MKPLGIIAISFLLLLAQGCTSNDRTGAGKEGNVTIPKPATETAAGSNVPPAIPRLDPAANGGSTLPASAQYRQANGQSVQQNINPAPFMVASSQGQGSASGATAITSGALTSRADGTMSGPTDQPPATTGWGTQGPQTNPGAEPGKPSPAQRRPAGTPPK